MSKRVGNTVLFLKKTIFSAFIAYDIKILIIVIYCLVYLNFDLFLFGMLISLWFLFLYAMHYLFEK